MSANNNFSRNIGSMHLLVVPHEDKRHQRIPFKPHSYIFFLASQQSEKDYCHVVVTWHWRLTEQTRISAQYTEWKVDFPKEKKKKKFKTDASVVVTQFLTFLVNWQDMSNNRLKNQLAAPSPVHISTSAPASAHCKIFYSFNKTFQV